jgi:hypothetical protein
MADFAEWAEAAEGALGMADGQFRGAYAANRAVAAQTALESYPVADAILSLVRQRGEFVGTATELLVELNVGRDTRQEGWPRSARALSSQLDRIVPNLCQAGLIVESYREQNRKLWRLALTPAEDATESASSQSSQTAEPDPLPRPKAGGPDWKEKFGKRLLDFHRRHMSGDGG